VIPNPLDIVEKIHLYTTPSVEILTFFIFLLDKSRYFKLALKVSLN